MPSPEPLPEAYALGSIPFLGLTIHLDSRPLIPRPETEWWTEQAIAEIGDAPQKVLGSPLLVGPHLSRDVPDFRVLDICSGSGAIGCAILRYVPESKVYFGEIDPMHEATIRKNIQENKLGASRAEVRIGDLFAPFAGMQFDFIAANPPYVPERRALPESVARYEPALALRAGEDGLAVIHRIAKDLAKFLAPRGEAWIECDSEHAEAARALFIHEGFAAELRTDQYDRPRLLVVSFPHG